MPEQTDDTQKIELTAAADYSQYLVYSKQEIVHILRAVMQKNELVTAYINHGNEFFLTTIVAVDSEHGDLLLDFGVNAGVNKKALESPKIIFLTTQDKVKIQFIADHIVETQFNGRPTFKIRLPQTLLKLQRREYYRLTTPIVSPLKCAIPRKGGSIEVNVVDISVGGIGIIGYPPEIMIEAGAHYTGCRIVLPDVGTIVTALEIRNAFEVTMKNGARTKRSGCQFVDMPGSMQAMIQRYIIKLDRDRRARLKGE